MVRILAISDTHLMRIRPGLPDNLIQEVSNCDLVIHAGDFTSDTVYDELKHLTDILAVTGNMDGYSLRAILPARRQFNIGGINIGIVHGYGSSQQALNGSRNAFKEVDLIVFGHSHMPFNETVGAVRMFNPGSPTNPRGIFPPSYGIIEINEGRMSTKIQPLEDRA